MKNNDFDFKIDYYPYGSAFFDVLLQPIFNFKRNEIKGYEVLSRVISESGELINNESFFERMFDDKILEIIKNQICLLKRVIKENDSRIYSINMPLSLLRRKSLLDELFSINFSCAIEITSVNCNAFDKKIQNAISNLKDNKVQVWMDDYKPYSSIQNLALNAIEWDMVKIDKSLIETNRNITKNIIDTLKDKATYGIIFEGLESEPLDLFFSDDIYCQGYFIGFPKKWSLYGRDSNR